MKLRYDITAEDLQAFHLHHHAATSRVGTALLRCLGSLILYYALIGGLAELGGPGEARRVIAFIIALAFFLVVPAFAPLGPRRAAERYARTQWRQVGEHEMEILPEALLMRGPAGEQRIPWRKLERIDADPSRTFLYLDAEAAQVISPAVCEGDYPAFVQALRLRLGTRPRAAADTFMQQFVQLPLRGYLRLLGCAALVLAAVTLALVLPQHPDEPPAAHDLLPEWPWSVIVIGYIFIGLNVLGFVLIRAYGPGPGRPPAPMPFEPFVLRFAGGALMFLALAQLPLGLHEGLARLNLSNILFLGLQAWYLWQASVFMPQLRRAA